MAARLPLVVLPSWSEAQPPTRLVDAILALPIRFDVLLVDPANGDADRLARERDEVHVLHAPTPDDGYLAAYRWALEQGYTHVLELDPHASPQQLPVLLGEMDGADLVVGSRFAEESERAAGGWRRALSAGGNRLTQAFLGLATRDCTSGLRCYRSALLECIPWDAIPSREYGLRVSALYYAERMGARVREVPVGWCAHRTPPRAALEAFSYVTRTAFHDRILRRLRPARRTRAGRGWTR